MELEGLAESFGRIEHLVWLGGSGTRNAASRVSDFTHADQHARWATAIAKAGTSGFTPPALILLKKKEFDLQKAIIPDLTLWNFLPTGVPFPGCNRQGDHYG